MINKDKISATRAMLGLATIPRWGIIEMLRPQSVAEHSFNVWILSTSLYETMFPVEHNSFEFRSMQLWALLHDMDEIYTGDIPTPAKDVLNRLHPGITAELKHEVLKNTIPEIASVLRGIKGTLAYSLVKIAETVEAIRFMRAYHMHMIQALEVGEFLEGKLKEAYYDAVQRFRTHDWDVAREWVETFTHLGVLTVPPGTKPAEEPASAEPPATHSSKVDE